MGVILQLGWMLYPWKEVKPAAVLGYVGLAVFTMAFSAGKEHRNPNDQDVLAANVTRYIKLIDWH